MKTSVILIFISTLVIASCKSNKAALEHSSTQDWALRKVASGPKLTKLLNTNFFFRYDYKIKNAQKKIYKLVGPRRYNKTWATKDIVDQLVVSSMCLGIDPYVMAGLVKRESGYKFHAYQDGFASGLTQFFSIAIKEVNHHLGIPNPGEGYETKKVAGKTIAQGAEIEAVRYFKDKLDNCVTKPGTQWEHLWQRAKRVRKHKNAYTKMRQYLVDDPLYALTYGAIYLKLMMIKAMDNKKEKVFKGGQIDTFALYREALMLYNKEDRAFHKKYDKPKHVTKYWGKLYGMELYWRRILLIDLQQLGIRTKGAISPVNGEDAYKGLQPWASTPNIKFINDLVLSHGTPLDCEGKDTYGHKRRTLTETIKIYGSPANEVETTPCRTENLFSLTFIPGTCVTEEADVSYYDKDKTNLVGWKKLKAIPERSSVAVPKHSCFETWVKAKDIQYTK